MPQLGQVDRVDGMMDDAVGAVRRLWPLVRATNVRMRAVGQWRASPSTPLLFTIFFFASLSSKFARLYIVH
jgi:hypothetical protein